MNSLKNDFILLTFIFCHAEEKIATVSYYLEFLPQKVRKSQTQQLAMVFLLKIAQTSKVLIWKGAAAVVKRAVLFDK